MAEPEPQPGELPEQAALVAAEVTEAERPQVSDS